MVDVLQFGEKVQDRVSIFVRATPPDILIISRDNFQLRL